MLELEDIQIGVLEEVPDKKYFTENLKSIKNKSDIKKLIDLTIGDQEIDVKDECVVCLDFAELDHIFAPCGHNGACSNCAKQLDKCPICRESIQSVVKVFS